MHLKMQPDFGRHVRMTRVLRSLQGHIQIFKNTLNVMEKLT